jgi:hypothetical protein
MPSNEWKKDTMEIPKYAKTSLLPLKTLYWMLKQQIIHNPLTDKDLNGLRILEQVWGKREILRTQLAIFSKRRRLKLIETADIATKWERYAFSRFQNNQSKKRLSIEQVINEIELTYGFVLKTSHIKKIYKIRRKIYNQRYAILSKTNI